MSNTSLPVLNNLRPPINDGIVAGGSGLITPLWSSYFTNLNQQLNDLIVVSPQTFGATGNGRTDDTASIQAAVNTIIQNGGGIVAIPPSIYNTRTVVIPAGDVPIAIVGQGASSVFLRGGTLTPGHGLFDIYGSNVTFDNVLFDGATPTPRGLQYGVDFNGIGGNDPMANSLTQNTSIWVHEGVTNLYIDECTFQHAAGYSVLLDATQSNITDVDIIRCRFTNNRPTLFGVNPSQLIFGSWNGGVLAVGDGRTTGSGTVKGLTVTLCHFLRNTGNCLWSHLYGLLVLHENFNFTANEFTDCGLDGILVGGVTGGVVDTNVFRRVGYTTLTDVDAPVPRWLANLNATALDSAGLVKGCPYTNNSFLDINGGAMDLDGHGDSTLGNNVVRVAYSDEPEYNEDSVATSGPNNNGSEGYGVNFDNSNNTPYGGSNVNVVGNTFVNLPGGSVRLYGARNCHVEGNNIVSPTTPLAPPITLGPVGVGTNQRATGNVIRNNRITYAPGMSAPAIFEDNTITPFLSTDVNYVFGNNPIVGNGNAYEFLKDSASGSPIFAKTIWDLVVLTENGANNAIVTPAGSGPALATQLVIRVLLAHTLQAGANTLAYNGGAAVAIKSHRNPASDIGAAYAVGAVISLLYNGTVWLDQSQ